MKKLFLISSLLLSMTMAFSQPDSTASILGQWTNTDTTFINITSDSAFFYEFNNGCYSISTFSYVDSVPGLIIATSGGVSFPVYYVFSNNDSTVTFSSALDTSTFHLNLFDISLYSMCDTVQYIGNWTNNDTTFLDITDDSIFYYYFSNGCYTEAVFPYTATSGNMVEMNLNGQSIPLTLNLSSNDSVLSIVSTTDTTLFYLNSFDISQYTPCSSVWACIGSSCIEHPFGQYATQAECIAAFDSDSSSNNSFSYLGKWKGIDETLRYLQFTSDSILIYQFDSTDCYNYNSLTCTDIGNSQLQIAAVITSTYSFSSNGDTMSIAITGLGDLQMVRDSFNVSSWIECTYNWKCNSTVCEDVGLNNGTFNSESECQASCTADTSGSDTTSINEYDLNVFVYPNPFSDYTTLSLSSNVVRYQLIDLTGRLVYNKLVENQVEYLHKNQLKSGVYMLHLVVEKGSNFERLLIE
ncbi:T9SS type A sorting domain-containing protein [Flavobacteriales bacterium]|nr:T9SS type A sorting domain-containing protein [Flavobacteriales bacterium]